MNPHLRNAYTLGVKDARTVFEKAAVDGDVLTSILGGVPVAGPSLAGEASGQTTPFEPKEMAARTSAGAAKGQALGGVGGALLGAGLGAGSAALYNALREKEDPSLWQRITGKEPKGDVDLLGAAGLGAALGGGAGMIGGGAYGAHKGRRSGQEVAAGEQLEELMEDRQEEAERQQRNMRILQALTQAHQMGSYGKDLQLQIPPTLARALQAQSGR